MSTDAPISLRRIFTFWYPMAATWVMMSLEGPFLAAVIARLAEPKPNLAAFGVAYAVAILVEAPVIMMLSASTALVEDGASLRRLRGFCYSLNAAVTVAMLLLLLTPLWGIFSQGLIGLSEEVAGLSHSALLVLTPWPAAIGYRRFYQGLLIRAGRTGWVAYGTVIRLGTMALTGVALYVNSDLSGAVVGAWALTLGVIAEAVAGRLMTIGVVREVLSAPPAAEPLTHRRILGFYWPLALTSLIGLTLHPIVTFFMGRAVLPLESLAVLPVVGALSFAFRSMGLSFQEVAIALLGREKNALGPVTRFALLLGVASSLAMAAIAFTPLATIWYRDISGLTEELTSIAILPTQIHALLPFFSVVLSYQRALLVHGRRTAPITWATALEVSAVVVCLLYAIQATSMVGATASAIALLIGRVLSNASLLPPCRAVVLGVTRQGVDTSTR